jgi:hypothetical protein
MNPVESCIRLELIISTAEIQFTWHLPYLAESEHAGAYSALRQPQRSSLIRAYSRTNRFASLVDEYLGYSYNAVCHILSNWDTSTLESCGS